MILKRLFYLSISSIVIGVLLIKLSGKDYLFNAINLVYLKGQTTANINDHVGFNTHTIKTSQPTLLPKAAIYNKQPLEPDFIEYLNQFKTAAYLVVKNGEIVSEHYFNGYHDRSKTNSFSVAKTILSLMLGIAIDEGIIDSLEQNINDFLPEFKKDNNRAQVTVAHLALMNSGYDWQESYYSMFSPVVQLYYGSDISKYLLEGHFSQPAGQFWEYSSASTQLLGILLHRALQKNNRNISLSQYLSEKIWQPLNMNDDALWHTDNTGLELTYCCINTNARNFAKLGLLMLNQGNWQGKQIIPAAFINKMTQPAAQQNYGLSIWLNQQKKPHYYWFDGHLGQYIIVVPEKQLVIVRLGESSSQSNDSSSLEIPLLIQKAIQLTE